MDRTHLAQSMARLARQGIVLVIVVAWLALSLIKRQSKSTDKEDQRKDKADVTVGGRWRFA